MTNGIPASFSGDPTAVHEVRDAVWAVVDNASAAASLRVGDREIEVDSRVRTPREVWSRP